MTDTPNTNEPERIRIDLSPEQQERVRTVTDQQVVAIELTVQELEARIAPRLAANHNETLLST
jgi:hypothetical protein